MIIKLSKYEVKIKDALTWGDKERLQETFADGVRIQRDENKEVSVAGSSMYRAKYVLLELAILEIKEGEKVIPYSKEWAYNLSPEDGDKLFSQVDNHLQTKKKD